MPPILRAACVLAFMVFVTVHTATGFVYTLLGVRPWAMVAIDRLVAATLVGPLGLTGAVAALAALSVLCAFLAYGRGVTEREAAQRPPLGRLR